MIAERVLEYVFPLREHFTATLWLPPDLTKREVERLTAMLEAIAIVPEPNAPHECCFTLSDEEHTEGCPTRSADLMSMRFSGLKTTEGK